MGKIKGTFAKSYDRFVKRKTILPEGLLKLVNSFGAREILELACGTGTVAIGLAQEGYNVTGVDYSPEMVKSARKKARENKIKVKFIKADILDINLNRQFDLILCLGNTVPHFTTERQLYKFFHNCIINLKSQGRLIIQQLNYDRILRDRPRTFAVDLDGDLVRFKQYRYHKGLIDFIVTMADGSNIPPTIKISKIILKPWTAKQMSRIAKKAGFINIDLFANYGRSAFSKDSKDLIFAAGKSINDNSD